MTRSRRDVLKIGAAIVPAALLLGCKDKPVDKPPTSAAKKTPGKCLLCAKCGEVKGSAKCCKEGIAKCTKCGLHKGSPGCCRIKDIVEKTGKDVCLCTYCGEVKGSDKCCKAGAMKCTKCGLNMGSPGCCRITREDKPAM